VALLGARPEVVEAVRNKLCAPPYQANVVVSADGYFNEEKSGSVFSAISAERPDLLFVAMGSPRQENVIRKFREICPTTYCMGVGGSFDVLAGRVRRAPQWAQKYGLEWFYRLVKQPKRILRQYKLMHFIWLLLINRI
jgi:UDP-N-acetyl-D-mannosaminouronate:lipid I N-acetyl-D-mannosaminouronosyltransferase